MKTTVELADSLLSEAKQVAAKEQTTLRDLLEEGLRKVLEERRKRAPQPLRIVTFKGRGLQPGVREGGWDRIRDLIYEGHGG
ncbi:MAG: type II toxin-antitoxin system VapB family antitoxin [Myxococcaceae bacterium]|nr:type II toxin-antitoxin system VapB family antitoxin [Myxococcaceae bacterium]MCI0673648.1 type II toxin-antitoxin system VapB family antitoxin [Myxococcaceae bacterium]